MTYKKSLRPRITVATAAVLAAFAALGTTAAPASAAQSDSCAAFVAILSDGTTFAGEQERVLSSAQVTGKTLTVRGTFVRFRVNLDTFVVSNYLLTGAPSDRDITGGVRTVIYESKRPVLDAPLAGGLELRIQDETIRIKRRDGTRTRSLKIDAKDCPQGDLFQMQPQPGARIVHRLADGFHYFRDAAGRLMFTNGTFTGREHPQNATLASVSADNSISRWDVLSGGTVEMVIGRDAFE